MKKLNQKGFTHWIVPALIILVIAAIGTYVLTGSHADSIVPPQLSLAPSSQTVPVGGTFTVALKLTTNGNSVRQATAEFVLPANLTCVSVTPTTPDFPVPGIASICHNSPSSLLDTGGIRSSNYTANGTLAEITLKAQAVGTGAVKFNSSVAFDQSMSKITVNVINNAVYTVATAASSSGEQLSLPPQRRPAQYLHLCLAGGTYYVTQGTPDCLAGGTFQYDYAPTVPGTAYNVPCATTTTDTASLVRLIYIASGAICPAGTSN